MKAAITAYQGHARNKWIVSDAQPNYSVRQVGWKFLDAAPFDAWRTERAGHDRQTPKRR